MSVDHDEAKEGKYFNFQTTDMDMLLATANWNNQVQTLRSQEHGFVQVRLWRGKHGGSVGDAHGRLDSGSAEPGYWQVGDEFVLTSAWVSLPFLQPLCLGALWRAGRGCLVGGVSVPKRCITPPPPSSHFPTPPSCFDFVIRSIIYAAYFRQGGWQLPCEGDETPEARHSRGRMLPASCGGIPQR